MSMTLYYEIKTEQAALSSPGGVGGTADNAILFVFPQVYVGKKTTNKIKVKVRAV